MTAACTATAEGDFEELREFNDHPFIEVEVPVAGQIRTLVIHTSWCHPGVAEAAPTLCLWLTKLCASRDSRQVFDYFNGDYLFHA